MVRTGGEVGDTFPKDGGGRELCVPIVVRTPLYGGLCPVCARTLNIVTYADMSKV